MLTFINGCLVVPTPFIMTSIPAPTVFRSHIHSLWLPLCVWCHSWTLSSTSRGYLWIGVVLCLLVKFCHIFFSGVFNPALIILLLKSFLPDYYHFSFWSWFLCTLRAGGGSKGKGENSISGLSIWIKIKEVGNPWIQQGLYWQRKLRFGQQLSLGPPVYTRGKRLWKLISKGVFPYFYFIYGHGG